MAVDLSGMQRAVSRMVESSIYAVTQNQKAKRGIVSGGNVIIGNKTIPYVPAVDMFFKSGDAVWCIISDSGKAVIVGV
jgi:hypothetical protein